jgi:5'-AMP-activated protein kinase catalytic alpha subunit
VKYAKNTVTGDQAAIKILDREKVFRHKMVEQVR